MPICVLYIHHSGTFGGASRSLLELVRAFPENSVKAHVITQKGNVAKIFKQENIPVIATFGISQFDNTKFGYYKQLRWLILLRELLYLLFTAYGIVYARIKWRKIDIVHINEITNIPSVFISKIVFGKPVIVHARSVQQDREAPCRYRIIKNTIKRFSQYVIAIDETVRKSLGPYLNVHVIHNGFDAESESHQIEGSDAAISEISKISKGNLRVAMVGSILGFKGVHEFIEAAKICRDKRLNIEFLIIGANSKRSDSKNSVILRKLGFSHDRQVEIIRQINKYGLRDYFYILGFTHHIHLIYQNIDILCFPSHLNAVGRPVIEASFFKVPSIVAIDDPDNDTIIDGETGICIDPINSRALADAIEYFYENPEEIKRMGESAYQLALKNFDIKKNAQKVLALYQSTMD